MKKLSINLENCYGIDKLEKTFSFGECKTNIIYAKNGTMKTSLAKVFKKIQENKEIDIKDEIFKKKLVLCDIKIDDVPITQDKIFVINSFEPSYESPSIATLLVNEQLKKELNEVLKLKDSFLMSLEECSGLKVSKTSLGKTVYELEEQLKTDFNIESFLQNLNKFEFDLADYDFSSIKYSDIFDKTILKRIKTDDFQNNIDKYLAKSKKIYKEYKFLKSGKFSFQRLKEVQKQLKENNFFVNDNKIILSGNSAINKDELDDKIQEIEKILLDTKEFKEIEKIFATVNGKNFKDVIDLNPNIIQELKSDNLNNFRKKLWCSYFKQHKDGFDKLKIKYTDVESKIKTLNTDGTLWQKAIDIFNKRFTLPFKMKIANLKSAIFGENIPEVKFNFIDPQNPEAIVIKGRNELEELKTLSQGESRALYLLNIIFDIEKMKKENKEILFVIDDIADSFDYKNKYAIIEYLADIQKENCFYMLILTHNFDFYRTVSSRLDLIKGGNRFHVVRNKEGIKIEEEHYQDNPFVTWKKRIKSKHEYAQKYIIALIPFVRNLVDFGHDKKIMKEGYKNDMYFLTNLLHIKRRTKEITFAELKKVYEEYIGVNDFSNIVKDDDKPYDLIMHLAKNEQQSEMLEDKIILAIAIRLSAEEFMIKKTGNRATINKHQTRELFKCYCDLPKGNNEEKRVLESVMIMTPENIHLNSFMYEPILDMDILELRNLYTKVKELNDGADRGI